MSTLTARAVYLQNVKRYWWVYVGGVVTVLVCSFTETIVPKFVQWAIDLLISRNTDKVPGLLRKPDLQDTFVTVMYAFVATLVLGWLTRIGWRQFLAKHTHRIGYDLRSRFWNQLRYQPLSTFQKYGIGDLMNIAAGDWNAARFVHGFTLVGWLDLIFFTTLGVILMLTIDPWLTFLCTVPVWFVPRRLLSLSQQEYRYHNEAQQNLSDLSDEIAGSLRTIKLQRATGTGPIWQRQLDRMAGVYAQKSFRVVKTGLSIFPWVATPTALSYAIILVLGIWKVQNNKLTIGELVALLSYIQLMQHPLWELGSLVAEWQKGMASLGRMARIYSMDIDTRFSPSPVDVEKTDLSNSKMSIPALSIENLSFSYPTDSRRLLEGLNVQIPKGAVVGIQGPIGAGKSTLLSLISGLTPGYTGTIKAFGQDLGTMHRDWITEHITVVPQRAFLFSGTVLQNLSLDGDFSENQVWKVLETVQIKEEIQSLPNGIHSWVGEWGINLSGGQRQRLAIARALLRPQPILLLDDCLSAVDAVTEEGILAGLRSEFANQTVVWVAHRSSTLRYCDEVYQMVKGQLVKLD